VVTDDILDASAQQHDAGAAVRADLVVPDAVAARVRDPDGPEPVVRKGAVFEDIAIGAGEDQDPFAARGQSPVSRHGQSRGSVAGRVEEGRRQVVVVRQLQAGELVVGGRLETYAD